MKCEHYLNNKSVIPAKAGIRLIACCLTLLLALSGCGLMHSSSNAYMPSRNGITAGEDITVQNNENIYGIAREHNVSMRELIVLNNLKPPYEVRPGQSLTLPAGGSSFAGDSMKAPTPAPRDTVERSQLSPIEPAAVTQGQPLDAIAPAPVTLPTPAPVPQSLNAAPINATTPLTALTPPANQPPPFKTPAATGPGPVSILNTPTPVQKQVATTAGAVNAAPAVGAVTTANAIDMKWPVQGPILSAFGAKGAGLNNDGVNIGAPKGAPVVAAAPGTVVYAGNEMKGFGNLVLIRHSGDWVTAYAHLDRVLVKKDSIVAQGDEIGTVGKTGDVPSPQLHFETRQNGKPVDPAGVIKSST